MQGTAAVAAIATSGGGFLLQLPKNLIDAAPSWSYQVVSNNTDYTLAGKVSLGKARIQIDCFSKRGSAGEDCILLAKAIDDVLSGYRGTLTDADATVVQGIFRSNSTDFFDDAGRTFRRMLEYEVWSQ